MNRIKRMFRSGELAVAVVMLCATTGSAQEDKETQRRERRGRGRRDPAQMLERMDANKDGKISKDEFAGPDGFFNRMDADDDGFLTEKELSAMRHRMRGGDDGAPKAGQVAPTFSLKSRDGKDDFDLASFNGKRPVVLFFGSYT